jgi:5-formyltetrahydrofolate cyclo-ligase
MTNGPGGAFHPSDPRIAKRSLRARMTLLRDGLVGVANAEMACDRAITELPLAGETVGGYWPIRSELDIRPILRYALASGGWAGLPISGPPGTALRFRAWDPALPLIEGRYGIAEPADDRPEVLPTVLLVPLLAFDRRGYRLGYGGGYYDRTLALWRRRRGVIAVGVGFAEQEVEAVPHDRHDQRLDWIVTERQAMRFDNEVGG